MSSLDVGVRKRRVDTSGEWGGVRERKAGKEREGKFMKAMDNSR